MLSVINSYPFEITDEFLKGLQLLRLRLPGTVYAVKVSRKRKVTLLTLAVCTQHVEADYLDALCVEMVQWGWTYNEDRQHWMQFMYQCSKQDVSLGSRFSF